MLLLVVGLLSCVISAFSQNITLTWPLSTTPPQNASQILDPRLASFSIEFAYLTAFGGNKTNPNLLTKALMERLSERTGVGPDVRPGGITIDSTRFDPSGPSLVLDESPTGGIFRTTFGPALYESLLVFPNSTQYVVSVNLGNDTIALARDEIAAAIKYFGWDRIRAFELGNEADQYAGGSRPVGWASSDYTAQFLGWTSVLTRNLSLPSQIFQAGGFAIDPTPSAPMTTVSIIDEGVDTSGAIALFAQHTYQYSTCDPARNAIATLPNLVNHQNITAYLDLWKPQIAAAKSVGKDFVVGEYNSVSCSGKENVTYGLPIVTVLYGASLNISRMYLHQGATLVFQSSDQANAPGFSWYDLWYPITSDRFGPARASPSFVAYLLIAEAVGSSNQSRIALLPEFDSTGGPFLATPNLAAYAIWDAQVIPDTVMPARLAFLNFGARNTTDPPDTNAIKVTFERWITHFDLDASKITVKRMSAPGLDSTDSAAATWAGQSFENGVASGVEVVESLVDESNVVINGGEGVIIFFGR